MQKNTLHKLTVIILITLLLTTTLSLGQQTPTAHRMIHYVGGTGPYNHTSIQDAVDFAAPGDTIYVYNGTYYELVTINKQLTLTGEDTTATIIDGNGIRDGILITGNNVLIQHFTIKNCNQDGIEIHGDHNTIQHTKILTNIHGITLINTLSIFNNIQYNHIAGNTQYGLYLSLNTTNNSIIQNDIMFNNYGVYIINANHSTFYHNTFQSNTISAYDPETNNWNYTFCPHLGNYWDDYTGLDTDDNGIGDTPHPIPGGTNFDYVPLMNIYGTPIAHFTYTPTGLTIDFDAATTIDHDGIITNYTWDFGDTTIGYGITPTHTYPQTQTYTVILTVTDNDGLTDTYTQTFLLNDPPHTPSNPNPQNNTTGHCSILLNWTGGDPNPTNTVTYDIYFGESNPPPKIIANTTTIGYDPGILLECTTYYWQIIAWDNYGATTSGPIWTFRTNCPPNTPTDPYPEHQATEVNINTILSWTATDPDTGQPLTYDIYFGTTSPPPKTSSNHTTTTYDPGTLNFDTTYYWQITTWDPCNETTTGPIWEFTTAPYYRIPDLDCIGSLSWIKVPPGSTQTGAFTILNIGDAHSKLNWQIASTPNWGIWNITPNQGLGLTPQAGPLIITVEVTAPEVPQSDFTGNIKIINTDDPSDYELIPITLTTPTPTQSRPLLTFLIQLLNQFPLLQTLLSNLLSLFD